MRSTRTPIRNAVLTVTAPALIAWAVFVPGGAQAAPAAAPLGADGAVALAERLGDANTAGSYLDTSTGKMVVNVTDAATAAKVTAAGATPKLVTRSAAQLNKVVAKLDLGARIPGTAWSVDPLTNQVLVEVDSTVTGAKLETVKAYVETSGGAARLEKAAGDFSLFIAGGQAIYGGGSRCSLGFNVRSGSTYYFLTAGHCTNLASTWYANSSSTTVLGSRAGSSFPGNDYGIVRYTNTSIAHPSSVWLYSGSSTRAITSAANATVNQTVYRSGSTTGVRSGRVTATGATVTYPQGTVSGLIRTTVCAQGGDSGGSLYAGNTALGLTSGGSGNCTFGGTTYFQPVVEAMNAYGVTLP